MPHARAFGLLLSICVLFLLAGCGGESGVKLDKEVVAEAFDWKMHEKG